MNTQVSIGQVKRDISELVNRVTYAGERIILTSRGKPKAALVSMQDYESLLKSEGRAADIENGWQRPGHFLAGSRNVAVSRWMSSWKHLAVTWSLCDRRLGGDRCQRCYKSYSANPLQAHCLMLVQTFADVQPAAPALWAYETTSAIAKAVHFGKINEKEARQALEKLNSLGVRLLIADAEQNRAAFKWTPQLKRASAYDSYYLVLARPWSAISGLLISACSMHFKMRT